MNEWEILINIFEKYNCDPQYIAECVYAYNTEISGIEIDEDRKFMDELVKFIGGDYK